MIRNEICCDICGQVVAEIEPGIFKRKSVIRKHLICKSIGYKDTDAHVCFDCIYEIRRAIEEKEQMTPKEGGK